MKRIIASVLVLVFVLTGCNWFKKPPQEAVNEGFQKVLNINKGVSSLNVKGAIQFPAGETLNKIQFTLDTKSQSDTEDKESPLFNSNIKAVVTMDDKTTTADLDVRSINKTLFLRLNALQLPGEAQAAVETSLASLLNVWWKVPTNDGVFFKQDQKKLQDDLIERLKKTPIFSNAAEDGSEDVEGIGSTRYRVEMDRDAIKDLIVFMMSNLGEVAPSPEEEGALMETLKEIAFSGAVSIGDDDLLHRVRGTVTVQPTQGASSSFDVDYKAWDYNKDVEITEPEGARDFNNLVLLPLLGSLSSLAPTADGQAPVKETPPEQTDTAETPNL